MMRDVSLESSVCATSTYIRFKASETLREHHIRITGDLFLLEMSITVPSEMPQQDVVVVKDQRKDICDAKFQVLCCDI